MPLASCTSCFSGATISRSPRSVIPLLDPACDDGVSGFSGDRLSNRDERDSAENSCEDQVADEEECDVVVRCQTSDDNRDSQCQDADPQRGHHQDVT